MASSARSVRPPLWRDVRVLRVAGQVAFVLVVFFILREMYLNATFQLGQRGRDLSYDFLGIPPLSPNWFLRKIGQAYVETIRNIPALVQIIFWYTAVILAIPRLEQSISIFGFAYISNRGAAVPTLRGGADFGPWGLFVVAALDAAFFVRRWRTKIFDDTGRPHYRFLWSTGTILVVA